jgi:hypothetical protein
MTISSRNHKIGPVVPIFSLRDYFAGQALHGLIASATESFPPRVFADAAYATADAMLAARDNS